MSSICFGHAAERTTGPEAVIRTSSSIRTPSPWYCDGANLFDGLT